MWAFGVVVDPHASMIRHAAARLLHKCSFRYSSQNRRLELSTRRFRCISPGAIECQSAKTVLLPAQDRVRRQLGVVTLPPEMPSF